LDGREDQGHREEGEPPSHEGIMLDPNSAVVSVMMEGVDNGVSSTALTWCCRRGLILHVFLFFFASFCLLNVYASRHKIVLLGVIEKEVDNGSVYLAVSMVP
jgi:hypothetical protein